MYSPAWLEHEILGNPVLTWGISIAVFLAAGALLVVARRLITGWMRALAERRNDGAVYIVDRVVAQTRLWFALLVALFVGLRLLVSTPALTALSTSIFTVGLLVQTGLWITAALNAYLVLRRRRQLAHDPGEVAATDLLRLLLKACVWVVIGLLMLDNLGINITALVAGLGLGGVAVALAAQNVLGDLFASLSIVLDRPFVVGDSLGIDDFNGRVERVGLKTTRLRSLSGEQLVFANSDLLDSRIRNFGRMAERRVTFSIGITYGTRADALRKIPGIVRAVVEAGQDACFERAHFAQYGDFALVFEVVYRVLSPDGNLHIEVQHRINLGLYERFAEEGIEFAFPTQTLYVAGLGTEPQVALAERSGKALRNRGSAAH